MLFSVFRENIWFALGAGSIATRFGYVLVWHHKGVLSLGRVVGRAADMEIRV